MIDEKILDELCVKCAQSVLVTHLPFHAVSIPELCRLARLGLWAEKHAVPALEYYNDDDLLRFPRDWSCFKNGGMPEPEDYEPVGNIASGALAALPKGTR